MDKYLQLEKASVKITPKSFAWKNLDDLKAWFTAQEIPLGEKVMLLAFSDDGVTWGILENKALKTSAEQFPEISPDLDPQTLQTAHLFNENGECRIWRKDGELEAVFIQEDTGEDGESFDQSYALWGTQVEAEKGGFSLLSDGRQGLRHAIPLKISHNFKSRSLRLTVRYFLAYDQAGQAYISASRLVDLKEEK